MLLLLEDPGMLPGGFGWKATCEKTELLWMVG